MEIVQMPKSIIVASIGTMRGFEGSRVFVQVELGCKVNSKLSSSKCYWDLEDGHEHKFLGLGYCN